MGAIDWDRRLFDSLIPLPDGTSYNAYLIEGSDKTALLDTVDPPMLDGFMQQLDGIGRIDFIVSHHAEQDHSGGIALTLERFPQAKVVSTPRAKGMLMDLLAIPEDAFVTVADGETLSLGDKTLKFIHTPWVALARNHGYVLGGGSYPLQLRFLRLPHCHYRTFRDR